MHHASFSENEIRNHNCWTEFGGGGNAISRGRKCSIGAARFPKDQTTQGWKDQRRGGRRKERVFVFESRMSWLESTRKIK